MSGRFSPDVGSNLFTLTYLMELAISSNPMPIEVIAQVIKHVHDPRDLYSLFTVSSKTFPLAAQALYRSPFEYKISERKLVALADWILALSPVDDKVTRAVRESRHISWPLAQPPLLEYLSFIRSIHWHLPYLTVFGLEALRKLSFFQALKRIGSAYDYGLELQMRVTWAITSVHMRQLECLEFIGEELDRYEPLINQMGNIAMHKGCVVMLLGESMVQKYRDRFYTFDKTFQEFYPGNATILMWCA